MTFSLLLLSGCNIACPYRLSYSNTLSYLFLNAITTPHLSSFSYAEGGPRKGSSLKWGSSFHEKGADACTFSRRACCLHSNGRCGGTAAENQLLRQQLEQTQASDADLPVELPVSGEQWPSSSTNTMPIAASSATPIASSLPTQFIPQVLPQMSSAPR